MELFKASNQWATRPPDERFWNLSELYETTYAYKRTAAQATVAYKDLAVVDRGDDLKLVGKTGGEASLSTWAMGQLCQRVGAPPSYIRKLPSKLAAENINHGLAERGEDADDNARVLFHNNGSPLVRAFTSEGYSRVWNADIAKKLLGLQGEQGWIVPPARAIEGDPRAKIATREDLPACTYVTEGELIGPAGVYASNHDMFVFLVHPERSIFDNEDLFRGFFVWNSEVGAKSFGIMGFLFKGSCGNHIVWGAKGVFEIRVRHVGDADDRVFHDMRVELRRFADESTNETRAKILAAKNYVVPGANKAEIIDEIFGVARKARVNIPLHTFGRAYDIAVERDGDFGDPNTLWGLVQGVTQASQEKSFADERVALDQEAGKLLEIAF